MNLRSYKSKSDTLVAPRKPHRSAYAVFAEEYRKKNPSVTKQQGRQHATTISEAWNKLNERDHQQYEQRYQKALNEFEEAVFHYDNQKLAVNQKYKPEKKLDKPVKPATGFFRYLHEVRDSIQKENKDWATSDISKEAGRQWNEMSDSQQKKYNEPYEKELEMWRKEMEKWNAKYGIKKEEKPKTARRRSTSAKKSSVKKRKSGSAGRSKKSETKKRSSSKRSTSKKSTTKRSTSKKSSSRGRKPSTSGTKHEQTKKGSTKGRSMKKEGSEMKQGRPKSKGKK